MRLLQRISIIFILFYQSCQNRNFLLGTELLITRLHYFFSSPFSWPVRMLVLIHSSQTIVMLCRIFFFDGRVCYIICVTSLIGCIYFKLLRCSRGISEMAIQSLEDR